MKIRIGTSKEPDAVEREVPLAPATVDPRPFEVRRAAMLDRIAKHRRSKLYSVDGGKAKD